MAIFSHYTVRLPMQVFRKNTLMVTKNCKTRFIMTTRPKLEKVLENLKKNPLYDKYASKIAKFQESNPEEFLQRAEYEEKKLQKQKGTVSHATNVS